MPPDLEEKLRRLAREAADAAKGHLEEAFRPILEDYAAGKINDAEARERMRSVANEFREGRLNLILDTEKRKAQSLGQLEAGMTPGQLERYPAWELVRVADRDEPRPDWPRRWLAAGASCNFEGALKSRFMALKTSPIWAALGAGEGGFEDALQNPFPPFAFGSGMGWRRVSANECRETGLV